MTCIRGGDRAGLYSVHCVSAALVGVVGRLLQPAVVPDSDHAEHGSQERVALGQDVSAVRRHQETEGRVHLPSQRGGLHQWLVHGGSTLGHRNRMHFYLKVERSVPDDAGNICKGYHTRQARNQKHLRVSCL